MDASSARSPHSGTNWRHGSRAASTSSMARSCAANQSGRAQCETLLHRREKPYFRGFDCLGWMGAISGNYG
jgi:hypothetical protein